MALAPGKVFFSLLQSEASDIVIKGTLFGVCQMQSHKNLLSDGSFGDIKVNAMQIAELNRLRPNRLWYKSISLYKA